MTWRAGCGNSPQMQRPVWLCLPFLAAWLGGGTFNAVASTPPPVPVIVVTDLYHPPQDPGDNFDLIAAYALPEVRLLAVVLDVTEAFRKPVADHPGLYADPTGPRDPGFIPVTQLNYLFDRTVPCAAGPFQPMRSPEDVMRDAPVFQQHGVNLILDTLRDSPHPVEIVSFGSARPVAVAFNRDPRLFRKKLRRLHLCAGSSEPGFIEWNVALDPHAFTRLLWSSLPIAVYPCATREGPFAYGPHNCYWKLPDLGFIARMDPALQRYLTFAFGRTARADFLRALDQDPPAGSEVLFASLPHNVWETAVWLNVANRRLVRRAHGAYRIVPASQVRLDDLVLPNELRPCSFNVQDDGSFSFCLGKSGVPHFIYDRGDPLANEAAFRQALPEWYVSIRPRQL